MNALMISPAIEEHLQESIPPRGIGIGHLHLHVAELDRAAMFYRDILGFKVLFYGPKQGLPIVFLTAGDNQQHIALNTFRSAGGTPPPSKYTGLHHFAIAYPDHIALARAVARVKKCGYPIDDARDHGLSLSVYLRDLDGNGIELYYDRRSYERLDMQGEPINKSEHFDVQQWLEAVWSGPGVPGKRLRGNR